MTGTISLVKLAKGEPQLGVTFLGYVKSAAPHFTIYTAYNTYFLPAHKGKKIISTSLILTFSSLSSSWFSDIVPAVQVILEASHFLFLLHICLFHPLWSSRKSFLWHLSFIRSIFTECQLASEHLLAN